MRMKWIPLIGISIFAISLVSCSNIIKRHDSSGEQPVQETTPNELDGQSENSSNNSHIDENDFLNDENDEEEKLSILEEIEDLTIAVLVNKENSLDENYAPDDLVTVEVPTVLENPEVKQLRKVAADALKDMFDQAKKEDIYLYARSGYRSYQTQVQLFNNYVERHGEDAANRYSARPGQSEHQTGLVMDVTSESVNLQLDDAFGETTEGEWLSKHAHEFGFIIRYPKGKENVTGYIYEPWHIRYLGAELATEVYESGLTYEEYLEKEGLIHEVNSTKINSEA